MVDNKKNICLFSIFFLLIYTCDSTPSPGEIFKDYSTLYVNGGIDSSNCTVVGYIPECACKTINQALILVNDTYRILEITGFNETYQESISITALLFGASPLLFQGNSEQQPTIECIKDLSAFYIHTSNVVFDGIFFKDCIMEGIEISPYLFQDKCVLEFSTDTNEYLVDEWLNIRNELIVRASNSTKFVAELEAIWDSSITFLNKTKAFETLLKSLEDFSYYYPINSILNSNLEPTSEQQSSNENSSVNYDINNLFYELSLNQSRAINKAVIVLIDSSLFMNNVTFMNNSGSLLLSHTKKITIESKVILDNVQIVENNFGLGCGFLYLNNVVHISNSNYSSNGAKIPTNIFGLSHVTISDSNFSYNNETSNSALYSYITVDNTSFNFNSGSPSAMNLLSSTSSVTNSNFTFNSQSEAGYGTILNIAGDLKVESSLFQFNRNQFCGGSTITHFGEEVNSLLIYNVTFFDNLSVDGNGGAIQAAGGNITILSSIFESNSGTNGGAIYINGNSKIISEVKISETFFFTNIAIWGGGGVFLESCDCDIEISRSLFDSNSAVNEGGAVRYTNNEKLLEITESSFENNYATNGGGLYLYNGKHYLIYQNSIAKNIASTGGGIYARFNNNFTDSNNIYERNYAIDSAGAFYYDNSNICFNHDSFVQNIANLRDGGAIYCSARTSGTISNTEFLNNMAPFGDGGGVITTYLSNVTFDFVIFDNNLARRGAAIAALADSSPSIFNSQMMNQMSVLGSVFVGDTSSAIFTNVSIYKNNATSGAGGVTVTERSTPLFENCTIKNNIADTSGGGVHIGGFSIVNFTNCEISENFCSSSGGGLLITDIAIAFFNNTIFNNNTAESSGGGIIISSKSKPNFFNCNITNNMGFSRGGGVGMLDGSNSNFINCTIANNNSPNVGGGMAFTDRSSGTLSNCLIIGNNAESDGGGIETTVSATLFIDNSQILNNTAGSRGGAFTFSDISNTKITNSLIANNFAISGGGVQTFDQANLMITNSILFNNYALSQGGAICSADQSTVYFFDSLFLENSSTKGGALMFSQFANSTIHNSTFIMNNANIGGAAIFTGNSKGYWENCTLSSNKADYGGGISTEGFSFPHFVRSNIVNNSATEGGAVHLKDKSSPTFEFINFQLNSADENGGGIAAIDFSTPTLNQCILNENWAYRGAGVYLGQEVNAKLFDVLVVNNTANFGAGLFIYSYLSSLNNVTVYNNYCTQNGGGIYLLIYQENVEIIFENTVLDSNIAAEGGGGMYVISVNPAPQFPMNSISNNITNKIESSSSFTNALVTNNIARNGGGIFYAQFGEQNITFGPFCSLNSNIALEYGGGLFIEVDPNQSVHPFINQGSFEFNEAFVGGGSIATTSENTINFNDICSNCSYVNNTAGYQTSDGFCSIPNHLVAQSYPQSLTLNGNSFSIFTTIFDSFNQTVKGQTFDEVYSVNLYSSDNTCNLNFGNSIDTLFIDPISGYANFTDLTLQGMNGSTCVLIFNTTTLSDLFPSIPLTSISIFLSNCDEDSQTLYMNPSQTYQYCGISEGFWTTKNIFIFGMLILLLLILLLLIWMVYLAIHLKTRKRKKKENFNDIPDFDERPKVTLEEILNDPSILVIPWEHLEEKERLGVGAGGVVYSGSWFVGGSKEIIRNVALKQVLLCRPENLSADLMHQFLVEIKLMSALKHKHIVDFIGVSSPYSNELYLIIELMSRGSVDDVIDKKRDNLPLNLRMKLLIDAAKGLLYLHNRKVIHRDIKPSNLLVDENWNCKVADLGVSTIKPALTKTMTVIGTPIYMAPEIITSQKYSESCDVYSFGVLMVEIITGLKPYSSYQANDLLQAQLLYQICNDGLRPSTEGLPSKALEQLAMECWDPSPKMRPSMAEVLSRLKRINIELQKLNHNQKSGNNVTKIGVLDRHSKLPHPNSV